MYNVGNRGMTLSNDEGLQNSMQGPVVLIPWDNERVRIVSTMRSSTNSLALWRPGWSYSLNLQYSLKAIKTTSNYNCFYHYLLSSYLKFAVIEVQLNFLRWSKARVGNIKVIFNSF